MPSYTTKEDIDDAVRLRHPEWLAKYITDDQIPKEVRQHLAEIIEGLFTGRIKPAAGARSAAKSLVSKGGYRGAGMES